MELQSLSAFDPVSLPELDVKAGLMTRRDNKYVMSSASVSELLACTAGFFNMLEIGGVRWFSYNSFYYDSPCLTCYYSHHQLRRKRFKIRRRHYMDTDINKLELKYKSSRSQTIKKRIESPGGYFDKLRREEVEFVESHLEPYLGKRALGIDSFYNVVSVFYKRITLVSKDGGERVTLDSHIRFSDDKKTHVLNPATWIVEAKTYNGRGIIDKILKRFGQRPNQRCSKYCLALVHLDNVRKKNQFARATRSLNKVALSNNYSDLNLLPRREVSCGSLWLPEVDARSALKSL